MNKSGYLPVLAGLLLTSALTGLTLAAGAPPSGGDFTIRRSTIDSGGGEGSGGEFSLRATIGQTDTATLAGGAFRLRGGFWTTRGELPEQLFKDGFEG